MKIIVISGECFTENEYLYAKDYISAVDCIVNDGWLAGDYEFEPLFSGKVRTIKDVLGEDWINVLKGWDIKKFNDYFDGALYMREVGVWEA